MQDSAKQRSVKVEPYIVLPPITPEYNDDLDPALEAELEAQQTISDINQFDECLTYRIQGKEPINENSIVLDWQCCLTAHTRIMNILICKKLNIIIKIVSIYLLGMYYSTCMKNILLNEIEFYMVDQCKKVVEHTYGLQYVLAENRDWNLKILRY